AVAVHRSRVGSYRPPVLTAPTEKLDPPQTIISEPVQIALFQSRANGAFALIGRHVSSVHGSAIGDMTNPAAAVSTRAGIFARCVRHQSSKVRFGQRTVARRISSEVCEITA